MATSTGTESSAETAAQILRTIFSDVKNGFTVRLWDGSEIALGQKVLPVSVIVPSAKSFKRILSKPTAAEFGEAYCDGDIDLEGDLFEIMKVADSMEEVDVSFWEKIKLMLQVKRLPE